MFCSFFCIVAPFISVYELTTHLHEVNLLQRASSSASFPKTNNRVPSCLAASRWLVKFLPSNDCLRFTVLVLVAIPFAPFLFFINYFMSSVFADKMPRLFKEDNFSSSETDEVQCQDSSTFSSDPRIGDASKEIIQNSTVEFKRINAFETWKAQRGFNSYFSGLFTLYFFLVCFGILILILVKDTRLRVEHYKSLTNESATTTTEIKIDLFLLTNLDAVELTLLGILPFCSRRSARRYITSLVSSSLCPSLNPSSKNCFSRKSFVGFT